MKLFTYMSIIAVAIAIIIGQQISAECYPGNVIQVYLDKNIPISGTPSLIITWANGTTNTYTLSADNVQNPLIITPQAGSISQFKFVNANGAWNWTSPCGYACENNQLILKIFASSGDPVPCVFYNMGKISAQDKWNGNEYQPLCSSSNCRVCNPTPCK